MKKFLKIMLIIIIGIFVIIGGYVGYVSIQYYRIEEGLTLTLENNPDESYEDRSYTIITYNIGFGAYTPEFSFFMDSGEMLDGTLVSGTNAKAKDRDTVLLNTNGAIEVLYELDPDFIFLQEVDIKATRSHQVNQYQLFKDRFENYGSTFAENFHSAFLVYPFNDPIGQTVSGLATFSKLHLMSSVRYQFPVDESFFNKFFDLDRAFTLSRILLPNDNQLVLINVHMSAYDEGGVIRALQLERLNAIMAAEAQLGHYVIVGGDFNHDIAESINHFPTEQKVPEWVYVLEESQLATGYRFASSLNGPTCRSTDMAYTPGVNYTVVIDGFIVSSNVIIEAVTNITTGTNYTSFQYSDHNPVELTFRLE